MIKFIISLGLIFSVSSASQIAIVNNSFLKLRDIENGKIKKFAELGDKFTNIKINNKVVTIDNKYTAHQRCFVIKNKEQYFYIYPKHGDIKIRNTPEVTSGNVIKIADVNKIYEAVAKLSYGWTLLKDGNFIATHLTYEKKDSNLLNVKEITMTIEKKKKTNSLKNKELLAEKKVEKEDITAVEKIRKVVNKAITKVEKSLGKELNQVATKKDTIPEIINVDKSSQFLISLNKEKKEKKPDLVNDERKVDIIIPDNNKNYTTRELSTMGIENTILLKMAIDKDNSKYRKNIKKNKDEISKISKRNRMYVDSEMEILKRELEKVKKELEEGNKFLNKFLGMFE